MANWNETKPLLERYGFDIPDDYNELFAHIIATRKYPTCVGCHTLERGECGGASGPCPGWIMLTVLRERLSLPPNSFGPNEAPMDSPIISYPIFR